MRLRDLHYWIGLLLGAALIPIFRKLHLPVRFDWVTLATAYWLVLAAQSIFAASLLYLVGSPWREAGGRLVESYRHQPLRIFLLLLFFVVLGSAFNWPEAAVLTVGTAALLEFGQRRPLRELRPSAIAVLLPALYFFAGFLLVLAYNDIIVSVRFNFAYDPLFRALDSRLLFGGSVSNLSHWALGIFPISVFHFLEFIYFGMFAQIGAALILVGLHDGKSRGLQFVGTILMAYYIALALFYVRPSQGPYYLCPDHFSRFPPSLQAYSIQKYLIAHSLALWNHIPIHRISTDYFIAFPCMHIAQPLIVMWFLRRWKRIVLVLCAYDAVLIVSILLLEWHYFVDVIAGVMVAGISLTITDFSALGRVLIRSKSGLGEGAPLAW